MDDNKTNFLFILLSKRYYSFPLFISRCFRFRDTYFCDFSYIDVKLYLASLPKSFSLLACSVCWLKIKSSENQVEQTAYNKGGIHFLEAEIANSSLNNENVILSILQTVLRRSPHGKFMTGIMSFSHQPFDCTALCSHRPFTRRKKCSFLSSTSLLSVLVFKVRETLT